MTVWCMRIACWIPNAANTLSEYAILIAFALQKWLHKRASMLRFMYIVCLVVKCCCKLLQDQSELINHESRALNRCIMSVYL